MRGSAIGPLMFAHPHHGIIQELVVKAADHLPLAEQIKGKRSLGFTDVVATEEPHPRTVKLVEVTLPKIVNQMAARSIPYSLAQSQRRSLESNRPACRSANPGRCRVHCNPAVQSGEPFASTPAERPLLLHGHGEKPRRESW